jgi:hypothetical protein
MESLAAVRTLTEHQRLAGPVATLRNILAVPFAVILGLAAGTVILWARLPWSDGIDPSTADRQTVWAIVLGGAVALLVSSYCSWLWGRTIKHVTVACLAVVCIASLLLFTVFHLTLFY